MTEQTQEEFVQAVYLHAAEQMRNGTKNHAIVNNLVEQGLDEESANIVVSNLVKARKEQKHEQGKKNMIFGILWFIGGLVVTAATYSAASNGGHYIVAWGAVIFGAIQFLQGLFQYSTSST